MLPERIDYTFQLPAFEGPLDLLPKLIEREELDITEIALAQVADQYLAHVRALDAPDPNALSAFLVLAARLLLIKSRRSEEHTSELQSRPHLVCRLLLEK